MQAETRKRYGIGIRAQMKTDCVVSVKGLVMRSCKPSVPGTGWSAARLLGILAINARRLDNQDHVTGQPWQTPGPTDTASPTSPAAARLFPDHFAPTFRVRRMMRGHADHCPPVFVAKTPRGPDT